MASLARSSTKSEHAESRSTSASSRGSGGSDNVEISKLASRYSQRSFDSGLPDYEYPVPLVVRNTFIDTEVSRPLSLFEFLEERRINSCPVLLETGAETEDDQRTVPIEPRPLRRSLTAGAQADVSAESACTAVAIGSSWSSAEIDHHPASTHVDASKQGPRVLVLSEALPEPEPELCSDDLPTIGSADHHLGTCKPCAFFHTRGCDNGRQCAFCHMCGPNEKRKRQKEKQAAMREAQRHSRRYGDTVAHM